MVEPLAVGLMIGGSVLLFFGAVLSVYGVALLGAVLGAGGGYLFAPTIASPFGVEGAVATLLAVPIGAIGGVLLAYMLLSFAVAAVSFVVGTYFGLVAVAPSMGNSGAIAVLIAIGVGIAAAVVGTVFTKTMMVVITSATGAALLSRKITIEGLQTAQSEFAVDPLIFEPTAPVFFGLFALGFLSQFGLFKLGWVTAIVARLPGARQLRDRGEDETAGG